jgi:CelD/BcsL family acetyltransferase involved in cellulose biosynthesis
LRIEIIDSIEKLGALSEEWNKVLAVSRADTIFLTSDWLISWWKGYQPSGRLLCLAVRNDTGKALGFAPFYIQQKKKAGIHYNALFFLGDGTYDSEYMGIFCLKGHEDDVFHLILDWLSNHQELWDVCEWNIIPEDSVSLPFIKKWAMKNNFLNVSDIVECSNILLPDSYEEYLDSLNKKHRKNVRYYCNRAIKSGQAEYLVLDDQQVLKHGLTDLYDLHTRRWNSIGRAGTFVDPGRKKFYEKMTVCFSSKGWLRLRQLNLFGRPAAVQIGFVYNGIYSALQEGFDPELGRECPGVVLRAMHIQELIQEGVRIYDFLGFPTEAKERWNTRLHYCHCLAIPKKSVRARTVVEIPRILAGIKGKLRGLAPGPVIGLKHKLQNIFKLEKPMPSGGGEDA